MEMQVAQAVLVLPYWDLVWAVVVVVATETKDPTVVVQLDRVVLVAAATEMVAQHRPIPEAVAVAACTEGKHQVAVAAMAL
jgi:hypothetical protein